MYTATGLNKRAHPENYRDVWTDHDIAAEAEKEFEQIWEAMAIKAA